MFAPTRPGHSDAHKRAEDTVAAALAIRLQREFRVPAHNALTVAKQLGVDVSAPAEDVAAELARVGVTMASDSARSGRGASRVSTAPTGGAGTTASPARSSTLRAAAMEATASASPAARSRTLGASARLGRRTAATVTALDTLPAASRRRHGSGGKGDIWSELSRFDQEVAAALKKKETQEAAIARAEVAAALEQQRRERAAARREEMRHEAEHAAHVLDEAKRHERELAAAARRKEEEAAKTYGEMLAYNAAQHAKKAAAAAAERAVETAIVERLREAARRDAERQKRVKEEGRIAMEKTFEENRVEMERRRAAREAARAADVKLMEEAEAAAAARDAKRAADAATREADIKRKLDAMSEVYKAVASAEAVAEARAEEERKKRWADQDAAAAAKAAARATLNASVGTNIRAQLAEHAERMRALQKEAAADMEHVTRELKAARLDEKRTAAAQAAKMEAYRRGIEEQILTDAALHGAADETDVDRVVNERYMAAVRQKVAAATVGVDSLARTIATSGGDPAAVTGALAGFRSPSARMREPPFPKLVVAAASGVIGGGDLSVTGAATGRR